MDTAKIEAFSNIINDFDDIISKNFNQYKNHNDFSFIENRTVY